MDTTIEVSDEVLVFGKYEGTIHVIKGDQVIVYCPTFDQLEPWLVTSIENIQILRYKGGYSC